MKQNFVQQINNTIRSVLNDVHTAMPGKIVAYNNGLVNVKPVLKFKTPTGKSMDYPVVFNVPVVVPHSGECCISVPIKAGDDCLLIVAEQSLDAWISGTEEDDAQLQFDMSNAICIPGLSKAYVSAQEEANSTNGVVIACGNNKISVSNASITVSGDLKVEGNILFTGECKQA